MKALTSIIVSNTVKKKTIPSRNSHEKKWTKVTVVIHKQRKQNK